MNAHDIADIESEVNTAEQTVNTLAPRCPDGENDFEVKKARATIKDTRNLLKQARTNPAITLTDFAAPLNALSQIVGGLADDIDTL